MTLDHLLRLALEQLPGIAPVVIAVLILGLALWGFLSIAPALGSLIDAIRDPDQRGYWS